jgi:two-component system response regulator
LHVRRLRVLHVEDNPEEAALLARACEVAGLPADFSGVPGGKEAIAYLKREPPFADASANPFPDLIVLDLRLPGMSGIQFLQWLRRDSTYSRMPVLVFTHARNAEEKARALAEGATGFFVKPPDFESLVKKMAEYMKQYMKPDGDGSR